MTVTVLLFASYADALGAASLDARRWRPGRRCATSLARVRALPGGRRACRRGRSSRSIEAYATLDRVVRGGRRGRAHSTGGRRMMRARARGPSPIDVGGADSRRVEPCVDGAICCSSAPCATVNDGRDVTGIDYSAYEAMAERELDAIVDEAVGAIRRSSTSPSSTGSATLALGDVSVAIAVGACASRRRRSTPPLRDRGAQAPRADLEARALRRRHARVGRSAPATRARGGRRR